MTPLLSQLLDLTEAIKEDWGGKPFVDLRNGWKYVLDNYPQVIKLHQNDTTSFPDIFLHYRLD